MYRILNRCNLRTARRGLHFDKFWDGSYKFTFSQIYFIPLFYNRYVYSKHLNRSSLTFNCGSINSHFICSSSSQCLYCRHLQLLQRSHCWAFECTFSRWNSEVDCRNCNWSCLWECCIWSFWNNKWLCTMIISQLRFKFILLKFFLFWLQCATYVMEVTPSLVSTFLKAIGPESFCQDRGFCSSQSNISIESSTVLSHCYFRRMYSFEHWCFFFSNFSSAKNVTLVVSLWIHWKSFWERHVAEMDFLVISTSHVRRLTLMAFQKRSVKGDNINKIFRILTEEFFQCSSFASISFPKSALSISKLTSLNSCKFGGFCALRQSFSPSSQAMAEEVAQSSPFSAKKLGNLDSPQECGSCRLLVSLGKKRLEIPQNQVSNFFFFFLVS